MRRYAHQDPLTPADGACKYSDVLTRRQYHRLDGEGRITPREREILGVVAEGATDAEVAALLGISALTVRKHLEKAYEKLGVHTRTGAVAALHDGRESM